jgi:hypothetical protein
VIGAMIFNNKAKPRSPSEVAGFDRYPEGNLREYQFIGPSMQADLAQTPARPKPMNDPRGQHEQTQEGKQIDSLKQARCPKDGRKHQPSPTRAGDAQAQLT